MLLAGALGWRRCFLFLLRALHELFPGGRRTGIASVDIVAGLAILAAHFVLCRRVLENPFAQEWFEVDGSAAVPDAPLEPLAAPSPALSS